MSIASGFTKMKNYILTSSGYKLLSRWTSSQTVHMGDGTDDTDTVEYRFGAMKGVTSSLATDNDEFALSASAGKNLQDQCTQLNQSLANKIPDYAHFDTLRTPTTGGATYNISKDGFFQLHGATLTTSASIFYRIRINNVVIEEGYTVNMRYGYYTSPLFPVLKNDIVEVEVDTNVAGVNYVAKLYHAR